MSVVHFVSAVHFGTDKRKLFVSVVHFVSAVYFGTDKRKLL